MGKLRIDKDVQIVSFENGRLVLRLFSCSATFVKEGKKIKCRGRINENGRRQEDMLNVPPEYFSRLYKQAILQFWIKEKKEEQGGKDGKQGRLF